MRGALKKLFAQGEEKATPVGHQEDSTGHQNGVGHQHGSTGWTNGEGHQKFHPDDHGNCGCPEEDKEHPGGGKDQGGPGDKATPVGHREDSPGHQNGVGHQHGSTGFENGEGHQKFHDLDDFCKDFYLQDDPGDEDERHAMKDDEAQEDYDIFA